jgi:aminoglycoside phosphotransferase family enzyme
MWLSCDNGVYYTTELKKCNDYFMEGLKFNRRFAPGVYQGLAPFITRNDVKHEVKCGRLITKPQRHQLKDDRQYVLVMNRLDDIARLDYQLDNEKIGNVRGMEFLAEAIAAMHKHLKRSPIDMGTPTNLSEKLHFNRQKFMEVLHEVREKRDLQHSSDESVVKVYAS